MDKIEIAELQDLNEKFKDASPEAILEFASERFKDRIVMTSSFQTQSVPLLYLVSKACPGLPIFFLDTGFHFQQTLEFRDLLIKKFSLNVVNLTSIMGHQKFQEDYGRLYTKDPDKCCFINKTEPLREALNEQDAWISGLRRDQTAARSGLEVFNLQRNGKVKICPIINWDKKKLWKFHSEHNLPDHPLLKDGYMSVGCAPCTRAVFDGDERSGRWFGTDKTECGIHTDI